MELYEQGNRYPPPQHQNNYYPPPPQSYAPTSSYAEVGQSPDNKIQPSSGWKDVWATVLFVCHLAAFIALSVIGLRTYSTKKGSTGGTPSGTQYPGITFDTDTVGIFGYSAIIGFGLSIIYLLLVNAILIYLAVAIYYLYKHYYVAGIIFFVLTVLYMFCYWSWRHKIPFSMVGVYETYYSSTNNNARLNLAMVFLVFSFYWTTQVITYVTHVTLAGLFATVYFVNDAIRHPILGSAKRALTTSFGSICFGGLLMAIVNSIHFFISMARGNVDSPIAGFILCILECIVGCIEGILEWFNYYAFSGVAIYGQAFVPSAKRTWALIKNRGIEAIINDNLIGNVLFMGVILVGILSSLFGFIYLEIAKPAYNTTGNMTAVVVLVCFLTGASMFSSIATVISSGVATVFVCLAEDPEALRRSQPMLFEKIRETWPQVVQGI
ncbi:plasma-membrane choline transporter-domain-containing protein [Spinellus fusiger]|nr:plasma-membrane choline transporter-domain-containing protein [Spinellus fusiger]